LKSTVAKRVLFISYPFPPVGGAGVQRTTKFVKYLGEFGWRTSVLTVANPSVPALDQSLVKDVPADAVVRRARTWEPSYSAKAAVASGGNGQTRKGGGIRSALKSAIHRAAKLALQPDPQILWMPEAVREGRRILERMPHAAIVASGPPFSTFLIGASLSRRTGLPLVLDYRDEWDISNAYLENKRLDRFSLSLQSRMQRSVVRTARVLMATTRSSAKALRAVKERARSKAEVTWIYNGYDPEDFQAVEAETGTPAGKQNYRLAYVGTLWNLTSVEPLVAAVERLSKRDPQCAARLELVFAGRRTAQQSEILARLKRLPVKLVEMPYVDHHGAVALVRSADGLCVLLSDVRAAERVVPAKIFEYMAARRAIIGIGPRGEMWELLKECPAARLNEPKDVEGIAATLAGEIRRVSVGQGLALDGWSPRAYDRRSEAGQLAGILDSIS
jgi:glycosyltransferase involved in cell wall biosynthesis